MTYRGGISGAGPVKGPGPATWAIFAVLATASSVAGCYKPSVVDGKLLCPTNACPDGFSCVEGHCWQGGIVSPSDGGGADDMGLPVDMSETEVSCAQPLCTPATPPDGCDPVCQTGCGCREKCSISSAGKPVCVPIMGPPRTVGQTCSISNYNAPGQDDNCAPGLVCLRPGGQGTSNGYCFTLCGSEADCPNSRCIPRPVAPAIENMPPPTASVCDVPYNVTPCDPIAGTGCIGDRKVCYLETPDPVTNASRTVCEYVSGAFGNNQSCDWSRDCFAGFVCPENDGGADRRGVGFCLRPCDMAHGCVSGTGSCQPYGSTYGYCVTN
jgi:hypothetical protein